MAALSGSYSSYFYSAERVLVTWEASQDYINNTSTITQKVYFDPGGDLRETIVVGNNLYFDIRFTLGSGNADVTPVNIPAGTYTGMQQIASHSKTFTHNQNGNIDSITLEISLYALDNESYISKIGSVSGPINSLNSRCYSVVNLDPIDRTGPNFVTSSIGTVNPTSIEVLATMDSSCDMIKYCTSQSMSPWSSEISISPTSSISYTITGLNPGSECYVFVQVRKASNHVWSGQNFIANVTTPSITNLTSVSNYIIGTSQSLVLTIDSKYNFTHRLVPIYNGSNVFTKSVTLSAGANNISLTSSEITNLRNKISGSETSITVTWRLYSRENNANVGYTEFNATVSLGSSSAPTLGTVTYADINSTTVAVTENSKALISRYSELQVTFTGSQAKDGASIASYAVQIGSNIASKTSEEQNPNIISFGNIGDLSGTVYMTVTVTDSRSFSTSEQVALTVIPYTDIVIMHYDFKRTNDVDETLDGSLSGNISPITVSNVNKNSVQHLYLKYKPTNEVTWTTVALSGYTQSDTGTTFEFTGTFVGGVLFDTTKSYNIQFVVQDKLSSYTVDFILTQGVPHVSFRRNKIGINNASPTCALDVKGDIKRNGNYLPVMYLKGSQDVYDSITSDISNHIAVLVVDQNGKVYFYSDQGPGIIYFTSVDHTGTVSYVSLDSSGYWN